MGESDEPKVRICDGCGKPMTYLGTLLPSKTCCDRFPLLRLQRGGLGAPQGNGIARAPRISDGTDSADPSRQRAHLH
jgi:hypothetical protein